MHEHTRPATCFVRVFGPLHRECEGGGMVSGVSH